MLPFDGQNPTPIVVMDNCSIHHVAEAKSKLEDAGILLIYLPPYSPDPDPDLNPIEEAFGYVKGYLRSHDDIAAAFPNPTPICI
jgi:transposase